MYLVFATAAGICAVVALNRRRNVQDLERYWVDWANRVQTVEQHLARLMSGDTSSWQSSLELAETEANRQRSIAAPNGNLDHKRYALTALTLLQECMNCLLRQDLTRFEDRATFYRALRDHMTNEGLPAQGNHSYVVPRQLAKPQYRWRNASIIFAALTVASLVFSTASLSDDESESKLITTSEASNLVTPPPTAMSTIAATALVSGSCDDWNKWVLPSNAQLERTEQIINSPFMTYRQKADELELVIAELQLLNPPEIARRIHENDLRQTQRLIDAYTAYDEGRVERGDILMESYNRNILDQSRIIDAANLECVGRTQPTQTPEQTTPT